MKLRTRKFLAGLLSLGLLLQAASPLSALAGRRWQCGAYTDRCGGQYYLQPDGEW